ncbi:hypothetical protein [Streptomyces sp. NPDC020983]|uniref:hypothetical protein n=1 Tax=Streptomyces sp. NPDC020983 TaxID=3365106 RepID=UPI0037981493
MTATTASARPPAGPRTALWNRLPLTRIVARQLRLPALLLLLSALPTAAVLVARDRQWSDAEDTRARFGDYAYHFARHPYDAHTMTERLLADGTRIALLPALLAAALAAVVTAREWETRRFALTLSQSVAPARWFTARWTGLAVLLGGLLLPLVVLYRLNVRHAVHGDLLTHGIDRQTACLTIGPVTVAYLLLGIAAGALAGMLLRRALPAAVAAPALTWLLAALLVRSRATLLLDFPAWSKVHGFHPGGVLGLQFYGALPQDSYLTGALDTGDYWPYQLAETALVLALAALTVLAALRLLHRRVAHPAPKRP